jgi:uncharacterized protein
LNLAHRNSHEFPEPLTPGEQVDVVVRMKPIAQTLPIGHRLRVSISTSYWPMIWPSPIAATITVHEPSSRIDVPIRADFSPLNDDLFGTPEDALAGPVTVVRPGSETRHITRHLGEHLTEFVASPDDGEYILDDIGTQLSFSRVRKSFLNDGDPLSARTTVECRATYQRNEWNVRVETDIEMTCDADSFFVKARLTAFDSDTVFAERRFDHTIARDHM